jgi:hypothetical protein
MTSAKRKFDWLKTKGLWGAKSADKEKIVAMTTTITISSWTPSSAPLQIRGEKGQQQGQEEEEQEEYF